MSVRTVWGISKAAMKNGLLTIFVVAFLLEKGLHAAVIQGPTHAVAETGKQVKLNCTGDSPIGYWLFSKDGTANGELRIVGPGCSTTVNAPFVDHYSLESSGGGSICNLIVSNTTMEQAGVYKCVESTTYLASILTVIDSPPVITVNNTGTAVENQSVIIECVLNHNGSMPTAPTLRPYFYWTNSNRQNVSSSYNSTTANTAVSQITVTAGRQNIMPYTCHVYLQLIPPSTPNYDNTTPIVSSSASSTDIEVLYGPSKPSSTSRPEIIVIDAVPCGISVLKCSSTGNPAPSYRWYDSAENVLSTTDTLDLAEVNRKYKCEANNTIRNESTTYTVSKDNCTSTAQCCVFPRDETTRVTTEGCDNGTLCDCSQGSSGIILTCNATSFPNASYMWNGQPTDSPVYDQVTMNGTYWCTAYFNKAVSNYTGNVIFPTGTDETTVGRCCETWELIISVLIPYFGWNMIAMVVFFVVYSRRSDFGRIINQRFPGHTTVTVCLMIASVFFGLIIIPIVVTIAYCSPPNQVGDVASNKKGSYPMDANKKDRHQRNGESNQEVNNPENARSDQGGEDLGDVAGTVISKWMIVGMWGVVIALLFPTAFVIVYVEHCNQMRFEIS